MLLLATLILNGCLSNDSTAGLTSSGGAPVAGNDPSNNVPTISGSPNAAVLVGDNYLFTPSASDADGDTLTFSIRNKPRWASFNSSTGQLTGQALLGDVGAYSGISITVSDGQAQDTLGPFSITVNSLVQNSAPQISGNPPASVNAGQAYSFTPSASDANGDNLTFSIMNKPRWASFDRSTGRLTGQALLGDVGDYNGIQISVSDGSATASLPVFSIAVTQVALGSMSLSWTPPTQNTDGSALTDLAGYKLYYGTSSGSYDTTIQIDNASVSTYLVDNLVPDTYFVVATSFNASGVESNYSGEAVRTVSSN